jgi:glycosyltransferase involved in cell wall biosynthesis
MRILVVTAQFLPVVGGAERQAHALAKLLLARGHRATVLTRRLPDLAAHETIDGVPVVRAIRTVDVGPLFGVLYVLCVLWFLLRHRREWDVVHVVSVYLDAYTAVATRKLHGLPVVVRPACAGYYGDLARLERFRVWPVFPGFDRRTIRELIRTIARADAFIANSREVREELVAAGCPGGKIAHIPNGVDLSRFHPDPAARAADGRRRLGLPDGPLVVFAGRLDPQKGLHTLVAAMRSPALAAAGAHLLLLGDGPQRADLAQAIERADLADRVLFRGVVEDVAPYLRAGDLFALPTLGEGMPNALLEAMATGLPCVASAVGGCRDVIVDGETGLLVPVEDATAFQAALEALVESAALRERLGAAARQAAVARFGLERMVDRYEACYRAAMAGAPVPAALRDPGGERP